MQFFNSKLTWLKLSIPRPGASSRWIYRVTDRGFPEEELEKLHEKYREYKRLLDGIVDGQINR